MFSAKISPCVGKNSVQRKFHSAKIPLAKSLRHPKGLMQGWHIREEDTGLPVDIERSWMKIKFYKTINSNTKFYLSWLDRFSDICLRLNMDKGRFPIFLSVKLEIWAFPISNSVNLEGSISVYDSKKAKISVYDSEKGPFSIIFRLR